MRTYQSDDVLNPGLLSGFKALDSHPGKLVGVVEQEPRLPDRQRDQSGVSSP